MNTIYLIPMFLAGLVLKIIDNIFDEGMSSKEVGLVLALGSIPLGTWLMFDVQGFILVGAIFWSTLFRGKIDNIGFRAGYFLTAPIWICLYLYLRPFPFSMPVVASFLICIASIVLTSVLHDLIKRKDSWIWDFLIEERFLIVVFDLPCIIFGQVGLIGIIGIFLLVAGYSLGGKTDLVMKKMSAIRKRINYSKRYATEYVLGAGITSIHHNDAVQSTDRPPYL